jgi:RNA methyltransferase, TrmH family
LVAASRRLVIVLATSTNHQPPTNSVRSISSRQNPLVRNFRDLADEPDPTGERVLLDGVHLVKDAHRSGAVFEVVVIAASRLEHAEEIELVNALEDAGVDIVAADDKVFASLSPVKTPSGVAAIARRKVTAPPIICGHPRAFVVTAIDVQDPGNVGSLLRAAEAGGATGAFVCGTSANPFSWKALRGSMGSAMRLPVVPGMTVDAVMNCVTDAGLRVVAAVPRGGEHPDEIDWRGPLALLVGGEGPGLSDEVTARADARVTIPMATTVESLNVAVAGGVLVYAARRQRIAP